MLRGTFGPMTPTRGHCERLHLVQCTLRRAIAILPSSSVGRERTPLPPELLYPYYKAGGEGRRSLTSTRPHDMKLPGKVRTYDSYSARNSRSDPSFVSAR